VGRQYEAEKLRMKKELLKLVPVGYKVMGMPGFFNYTDSERIKNVIQSNSESFFLVRIGQ